MWGWFRPKEVHSEKRWLKYNSALSRSRASYASTVVTAWILDAATATYHQGMIVAFIAKVQRKDGPLKACLCDGPKSCQAGGGALTWRDGLVTSQSSSTHHGGPHNVWSILPQRLHGTPLSQPVLISALTRPSACQSGS